MAVVSMVVRHLLDRDGAAVADENLYGWVEAFSSLLEELGHSLEIRQEGTGWEKVLPGGERISAVPERDPGGFFLPNVSQALWEHSPGISLAIYGDPLLVYPQAHATSVALGQSVPSRDLLPDNSAAPRREEWLEGIRLGLTTVSCVVANNSQFIQWAVSTWSGMGHKFYYIPDWFEGTGAAGGGNSPGEGRSGDGSPQIIFPCPAQPRFGISETLRVVETLRRQKEGAAPKLIFCGALPASVQAQMQRWFDERPGCRLLQPGTAVYREGDIALFPVKSGPVPVQTILQAMEAGAAVVGSMQGPLVDMISHGHNGLLIRPVDPDLQEAIGALMERPSLRRRLGEKARLARAALRRGIWASGWRRLLKRLIGGEQGG